MSDIDIKTLVAQAMFNSIQAQKREELVKLAIALTVRTSEWRAARRARRGSRATGSSLFALTIRPDGKVPWRWPADDKPRKSDARRTLAVLDALSVDLRQSYERETDQITQLRLYAAAAGLALARLELAQIVEGT